VAAPGNVVAGTALIARPLGIGISDLLAALAEAQGAAVHLVEEGLRPVAKPAGNALGLGEPPCPLFAPAEVVLAQALLLGAGLAVALGFFR
jgi:hypothetical protein